MLNLRRPIDGDITLVCHGRGPGPKSRTVRQGTEVKAHSWVLAGRSEYFETALSGSWKENASNKIEFKDVGCVYFFGNLYFRTNFYNGFARNSRKPWYRVILLRYQNTKTVS